MLGLALGPHIHSQHLAGGSEVSALAVTKLEGPWFVGFCRGPFLLLFRKGGLRAGQLRNSGLRFGHRSAQDDDAGAA